VPGGQEVGIDPEQSCIAEGSRNLERSQPATSEVLRV
jgi:hypothetical protein